jgi:hypothetical protein
MNRQRAWSFAILVALTAVVLAMFLPSTLNTLHHRRLASQLTENRSSYQRAVEWALSQRTIGWINLPLEFRVLSENGSVFLHGRANQRIVCFLVEDDGELVRFLGYVEPPRKAVELLDWVEEDKLAYWTETTLDEHWQVIVALP